ncbi:NAD(P)-dependent dehydrogenase (short-subunit alcohol dehydrogenase family) [Oxalobacteraceae bacterium GrIS 2.11]
MKPLSNTDKPTVLITGAGKRIGRCIALKMAQQGWDVAIHYHRSEAAARELEAEIKALGRRAICVAADLSNEAAVKQLVPQVVAALGALHCVVNNASLFEVDTAADFSQAMLDQHMHVNVAAPVLLAQALHLVTPDTQQGCVINILDQKLFNLNPDFFSYTLSKAALQCATTTLAQALAPRVRVVGLAPGTTLPSIHQDEQNFAKSHRYAALDQSSTPQDIADGVVYLAGARAVTGTILAIDGGQHLIPLARDVMYVADPIAR